VIDRIFSQVTVPGVPSFLGPEFRARNDAPPLIVWEPVGGSLSPGKRVNQWDSPEPRSLATCALKVTCYLWAAWSPEEAVPDGYDRSAADSQALWELLRKFLVALRSVAPGAYALGDLRFMSEDGEAFTDYGKAAEVDLYWDVPITDDPRPTVTITAPADFHMQGTLETPTPVVFDPTP